MNFEDYLRTRTELGAALSVYVGSARDAEEGYVKFKSLMISDDKSDGTWFWDVKGDNVTFKAFVGND